MVLKIKESKSKIVDSNQNDFNHQFKSLLPTLLKIYLPIFCLFFIIKLQNRIPISHLTQDPLAIIGRPIYFGFISHIGILFWCSCAAICFFTVAVVKKNIYRKLTAFFFYSGCITTILLLDDLFLLHDVVFPEYLNISEKVVYLVYGITILIYLLKFKKVIQQTEFIPLLLAFLFFGFSLFADVFLVAFPKNLLGSQDQYLLEDGAKLLGIVSWFTYFTRICMTQIKQAISAIALAYTNLR